MDISCALDRLDRFMESYKSSFDKGSKNRKVDSGYIKAREYYHKFEKSCKDKWATATPAERTAMDREIRRARNEMFTHPYYAPCNDSYKCLYYCRYADYFIISVIGSKEDAQRVKADLKAFLADTLKLEQND